MTKYLSTCQPNLHYSTHVKIAEAAICHISAPLCPTTRPPLQASSTMMPRYHQDVRVTQLWCLSCWIPHVDPCGKIKGGLSTWQYSTPLLVTVSVSRPVHRLPLKIVAWLLKQQAELLRVTVFINHNLMQVLPFSLMLFLASSMSHVNAAVVQVAYRNAKYLWPGFAGMFFAAAWYELATVCAVVYCTVLHCTVPHRVK